MTKYGRRLSFGIEPIMEASRPRHAVEVAQQAEALGLDAVGIWDDRKSQSCLDIWTLLTAMGMSTNTISLFAAGPVLALRHPVSIAQAAATLDTLTLGRIEVGLAVDDAWEQSGERFGDTRREDERHAALEEAVKLMHLVWRAEQPIHFRGTIYEVNGLEPPPKPKHPIGVWVAGVQPKALALAGRLADGWIARFDEVGVPHTLAKLNEQIDVAAREANREPADIRRVAHIRGEIATADHRLPLRGSVRQWAEALAELAVEVGIDTFMFAEQANLDAQIEYFAHEVIPYTRELAERALSTPDATGLLRAYQGAGASGATPAEEATGEVDLVDETSMESFPASDPPASSSYS